MSCGKCSSHPFISFVFAQEELIVFPAVNDIFDPDPVRVLLSSSTNSSWLLKVPSRELTKRGRRRQRGLLLNTSSRYSYHYETISCRFAFKNV